MNVVDTTWKFYDCMKNEVKFGEVLFNQQGKFGALSRIKIDGERSYAYCLNNSLKEIKFKISAIDAAFKSVIIVGVSKYSMIELENSCTGIQPLIENKKAVIHDTSVGIKRLAQLITKKRYEWMKFNIYSSNNIFRQSNYVNISMTFNRKKYFYKLWYDDISTDFSFANKSILNGVDISQDPQIIAALKG